MPSSRFLLTSTFGLAILASTILTSAAVAQTEQLLHVFRGPEGSAYPNGALIADSAGNLYGTTAASGNSCSGAACGTVFELSPAETGGYTQTVLLVFSMSGKQPWNPQAGLAMDSAGSLYGTTLAGGLAGSGTVFKLTFAEGSWTETTLHSFGATGDGASPQVGVILDAVGNIYGTTPTGGSGGSGAVYELSPSLTGYAYRLVHSFHGHDGSNPGQLIMDSAGHLYGTTLGGGADGEGAVFRLSPPAAGGTVWTESILYSFPGAAASGPAPYLAIDGAGNLYGAANGGSGGGIAFELSPSTGTTYSEQVIYDFCAVHGCPDGFAPVGFIIDGAGNLFGAAPSGGSFQSGTAVELSPPAAGETAWTANLLHTFGNGTDGALPAGLLLLSGGNLYGSTTLGGKFGYGTVFRLMP